MKQQSLKQQGFTLVEMAIVLVIIGLLLGGVLKGQELIESSRVKSVGNEINGVIAAYNGYVDRYRAIPGDDNPTAIGQRGNAWGAAVAGNGDGVIGKGVATFTDTDENLQFWVHLRASGFLSGDPSDVTVAAIPKNAFGGKMSVTSEQLNATGATGTYSLAADTAKLCLGNIPGKAARSLDNSMDDGRPNAGLMLAYTGAGNTAPKGDAATAYSDDKTYTVCRTF